MNYTIIHVNDRAIDNINGIIDKLKTYNYIDKIKFVNGNIEDAKQILENKKINTDNWEPYDGRSTPVLPGELGIWASTINCFEYMVNNSLENLLIFEDDISLKQNFIEVLEKCLQDLPKNFDFLALYYFQQQNYLEEKTSINSNLIHKSLNQYSGAQAILYSLKGAQKILKLVKDSGIEYTCDCYIFNKSHLNMLEGYSIRPDVEEIVSHEIRNIPSLIDKNNIRNVF